MVTGRCACVVGHRITLARDYLEQLAMRDAECQYHGFLKHRLVLVVLITVSFNFVARAETPKFNRDIRPILSGRCFKCHGPDANAREADLRLDRREVAIDAGAVVSGSPEASQLMQRITSTDPDLRMPPVGDSLSAKEIGMLDAWIASGVGSPGSRVWSFRPCAGP